MALFFDDMPCSLCGEPIRVGHDTVATTHFIGDESDPFYRYSDTVMHRGCFEDWAHREEFTLRYRENMTRLGRIAMHDATWPGPPGSGIIEESPPSEPPPPATHFCPRCNAGLTAASQGECRSCGWLRFPSDRSRWGQAGACPTCGFSYEFDGASCSHCGRHASPGAERGR